MRSEPPALTLPEAAAALGVHYMTAYRYIRQGRLPATKNGAEWLVCEADVRAFRRSGRPRRTGTQRVTADRKALEERMVAGDGAGAWWLIESHLGGGSDAPDVLTELLVPVMRSIGDRWAAGDASIADEHQATAVAHRIVGRLGLQFGLRGKSRGTVVLAAPAGELHTLPGAIVSDLLRWRGFDVLDLGGNTPADALASTVRDATRLVAVGIAATASGLESEVASSIAAVRAITPDAVIFLGGRSIASNGEAQLLGADFWTGEGAHAAVDAVELIASMHDPRGSVPAA